MGQKRGYQKIVVMGNLGRDADLKATQAGKPMIKFSLAVTTGFGDNTHTEWFNVAKVGENVANLAPYLKSGKAVIIDGRLETRTYEDNGEQKRWTTLWADSITLLADGNGNGNGKSGKSDDDVPTGSEDEIPF